MNTTFAILMLALPGSALVILVLLLYIGIIVLALYFARDLVCWYLKINERNELIRETNRLLAELLEKKKKDQRNS